MSKKVIYQLKNTTRVRSDTNTPFLLLNTFLLAVPKFSRELGRVSNFNKSIN